MQTEDKTEEEEEEEEEVTPAAVDADEANGLPLVRSASA